jgi:hypothetical protein
MAIIFFTMHTFIESFISFDFFFLQMFGCLLGIGSFDGPKSPLACKQTSLPITFRGVQFISTSIIAPIAYLRSWALVALVITARFMVDQHPFLLEALTRLDNNTFPFPTTLQGDVIFYHPRFVRVFSI